MGFLSSAERVVLQAAATAMFPPPPPDITRWCEDNVVFDERSPFPGPFRIALFPFLREIHEVLSPEHPCREATLSKSAQLGGTVSVINPCVAAWHEYTAVDSLVVHPTTSSATEWVNNKWLPMRRATPSLRRMFGDGNGPNTDNTSNQETVSRTGSLKIASAGSPDDLAGTSRRLVIADDLSKFEMNDKGDPESMMVSRASAFEDAKILRVSTPQIRGTCRITKAYDRSDQRKYFVPCPHCGNMFELTWENFRANINPEKLSEAHFTCNACGAVIDHSYKSAMVNAGKWVATNPSGDHPGFHIWRAYAPHRDWASIARDYAQAMGWGGLTVTQATEASIRKTVEAETEQTFYNDVLGLPYEQASSGPNWEGLRDRSENAEPGEVLPRGTVPVCGVILTAGVDCQADRMEVHIVAFGKNAQRWVVDYVVIPHHVGDPEGGAALDALLKTTWKTERGLRLPLDMMAVDVGTFTSDIWAWAKTHPWSRVILVKGASTQNGPIITPFKGDRKADGQAKRMQKRAFLVNVSQMKADFYHWLAKTDPDDRGHCSFCSGLGDEYYRQITSEVRVLKRARSGVVTSAWELVEPTRRNEGLDTMNYAEAAARRKSWLAMTDEDWDALRIERGAAPISDSALDAEPGEALEQPAAPVVPAPVVAPKPRRDDDGAWIKTKADRWI